MRVGRCIHNEQTAYPSSKTLNPPTSPESEGEHNNRSMVGGWSVGCRLKTLLLLCVSVDMEGVKGVAKWRVRVRVG